MGCGCQDIEKDAMILNEIERRKKIKEVPLAFFNFIGDLWKLKEMDITPEQIKSIKQIKLNEWEVIYEKKSV